MHSLQYHKEILSTWAKSDDMTTKGIDFWKLVRCLPGQRKAALHWHEHFESTLSRFDFIPFEGMVTVYKRKVKCMYITIHVDDRLVIVLRTANGSSLKFPDALL